MYNDPLPRDLHAIGAIWNLPAPLSFRPLVEGTNNSVHLVETGTGSFVARLYRNHTDPARLRFECAVLEALQASGLPFSVPTPIPTVTGERYVRLKNEQEDILVTLTARIAGQAPQCANLEQATDAGEALGVLDLALRRLDPQLPEGATSWRSYGDLEHCHPMVPDPYQGILELPIAGDARRRLLERYQWLSARIPSLYASLPKQLSHEDYGPSNVLMEGNRVTGVLDFEFCAQDVRAMDLTVALSWWPAATFGTGDEWPILLAFTQGFARRVSLSAEEVATIPTLYQLRAYTSLIHRLGRCRQGLSSLQAVVERAQGALEREAWLATHEARLLDLLYGLLAG
jgi:homoserine kinase type II